MFIWCRGRLWKLDVWLGSVPISCWTLPDVYFIYTTFRELAVLPLTSDWFIFLTCVTEFYFEVSGSRDREEFEGSGPSRPQKDSNKKQEILEITISPTFLTWFSDKVSVSLFNYGPWFPLLRNLLWSLWLNYGCKNGTHYSLHKYCFNPKMRMFWLPLLRKLTLHILTLIG
jgi:hypothetical protein